MTNVKSQRTTNVSEPNRRPKALAKAHTSAIVVFIGLALWALFLLGFIGRRRVVFLVPCGIAVDNVTSASSGDQIEFPKPQAELMGHINTAFGFRVLDSDSHTQIFACAGGPCKVGTVRWDGSWKIPDVLFRHPAESDRETDIKVVLADATSDGQAPKLLYSKIIHVRFPRPEVTLERVCGQTVTLETTTLPGCEPLTLEGRAKSLLWESERICIRVQTAAGRLFNKVARLESTGSDAASWSAHYTGSTAGIVRIEVGLGSVAVGAACDLHSLLVRRSIELVPVHVKHMRRTPQSTTIGDLRPLPVNYSFDN